MRVFVTGGAGFIGSEICERLLQVGAEVVAFDDFSTGRKENIKEAWVHPSFAIIEGDVRNYDEVLSAMSGCTHIAHLAAMASVPASVANPALSEAVNLQGTLNVIEAAKQVGVKRIVFSSTAAVYGNATELPVTESTVTQCQSPYAEHKLAAEIAILNSGIEAISLRYFNVHGPRQDPNGAYAAVIPVFIKMLMAEESPTIFGTGEATRDFVSVFDVAILNLLALTTENDAALGEVYNVASGSSMSVLKLFQWIRDSLYLLDAADSGLDRDFDKVEPVFTSPRDGDILHSSASIEKARQLLGFEPEEHSPIPTLAATVRMYWAQRD